MMDMLQDIYYSRLMISEKQTIRIQKKNKISEKSNKDDLKAERGKRKLQNIVGAWYRENTEFSNKRIAAK